MVTSITHLFIFSPFSFLQAGHSKSSSSHRGHGHGHGQGQGQGANWSPYGCHYYPDPGEFPEPNPASLPEEPLTSGEQYFIDLAGNIKKVGDERPNDGSRHNIPYTAIAIFSIFDSVEIK